MTQGWLLVLVWAASMMALPEVLLLREADLMDIMLPEPEDKLAVLPELHLTAALGEHTIQVHLQLSIVDAVFVVV
jgi:hypothetical protein